MNLKFLKNQLASVIEWTNQQQGILLYKYPSANDEIKNASKLIIGPGQGAILVYEGSIVDVLDTEGIYVLETGNHPFITTLIKLRTAFESEHKLKIYFFRTSDNTAQNWGTAAPIKYVDPVYKFPVEIGANGNFSFSVSDAKRFFSQIAGLADLYTVIQARALIQSRIAQILAAKLAYAQISYQQIDSQLDMLSDQCKAALADDFTKMGLLLDDFRINGTVFDKDTQTRIGAISNITADSQAATVGGLTYVELEKLKALRDAAKNQSGVSGAALQIGAGLAIGKLFTDTGSGDAVSHLQQLKQLLDGGIITQQEFDAKKKEWLDKL